jgi:hypothetical protein
MSLEKRAAYWTYDDEARAYYFAPANRASPPYRTQRHVTAILDIAADGTLAGVELVMGDLPEPPTGSTRSGSAPTTSPITSSTERRTKGSYGAHHR